MSNLIKKVKIMQEDGTFTDYIPLGAEAENINVDGESVDVKLSKKPYYYNTVADMKADDKLKNGDMAITLGYYEPNDGGGAEYNITNIESETDYQENLKKNLYANLLNIYKYGYIDLRWLGADSTGQKDASIEIQKAVNYSNDNYSYPIKIMGKYLIEKTINVSGALNLFGNHNNSRLLIEQSPSQIVKKKNISSIKIADNITAFNLIGEGNNTTRACAIYLKNINIYGNGIFNNAKFINITAYGAPSRPSYIKECEIHDLETFIYSNADDSTNTDGTLIYNLDVCNNNMYNINYAFNIISTSKATFGGLNIHDNVLEQGGAMLNLQNLFGCNIINNNLMEGLTNSSIISVLRGSLEFNNNYFEVSNNTFNFNFNLMRPNNVFSCKNIYILNCPDLKINLRNLYIDDLPNYIDNFIFTQCLMSEQAFSKTKNLLKFKNFNYSNITNLPIFTNQSLFNVNEMKSLNSYNPNIQTIKNGTTVPYLLPVNISDQFKIYGENSLYTNRVSGNQNDICAIAFWKPKGVIESIGLINNNGIPVGLQIGGVMYDEGFYICTVALNADVSTGAVQIKASNGIIPNITFINLGQDGKEKLISDFVGILNI